MSERDDLKAILEALIFASPEPLTPKAIYKLLDSEPKEDVLAALAALKQDYERPGGLHLVEVAGGYQIVTRSDLHEWVRRLFQERTTQKLTAQALARNSDVFKVGVDLAGVHLWGSSLDPENISYRSSVISAIDTWK